MESAETVQNPSGQQLLEQVDKILASRTFGASDTMRHLLQYLAKHTIECPGQVPKEHEIAVTLLGRSADFDPKLDPVVRVQASRLRSKLAEYYVAEGSGDELFIDVPKGTYCLHASFREMSAVPKPPVNKARHSRRLWWILLGTGLLALLTVSAMGIWKARANQPEARLRQFWSPFLEPGRETLVVFANPRLVGSSASALRLFDPEKDQASAINPGYAGVGEVMGAAELTKTFARLGRAIRLKRSQLFSWDDANAYNLIFIGAPPHNVSLFQLPLGRKLKFKPHGEEPRKTEGCVRNLDPGSGEQEYYCSSNDGLASIEYSMVTFSFGTIGSRPILVAAGTTTFGTQATVEFICDPDRAPAIARLLGLKPEEPLPPFDALIRCTIRSGAPVGAELILVKK